MTHTYQVKATYHGGLDGDGGLATSAFEVPFSVPKDLKGAGLGTNPEELLLGAAAGCFLITLGTVLTFGKIPYRLLELRSEIELSTEKGLELTRITHFPTVYLSQAAGPEGLEQVKSAIVRAESFCIVAKALRGNVAISIVPTVKLEE